MQKWLWGYVLAVVAVGSIIVVQNVFELGKGDWAAWVQAIGSIGAIVGAFQVGRRQIESGRRHALEMDRLERTRKNQAVVAVVHHAVSQAKAAEEGFRNMPTDVLRTVLDRGIYALVEATDALFSIPLHQVGPSAAVVQFAQLQVTMKRMSTTFQRFGKLDRDGALIEHIHCSQELSGAVGIAENAANQFTQIVNRLD
ncbi:hypothetical protein [Paraburkholderia caledonica]|uniref:hypothetical protein n=1 Tax=Paraburkholderia caledonica TaxID=134536 RepID=UPI0038BCD80D